MKASQVGDLRSVGVMVMRRKLAVGAFWVIRRGVVIMLVSMIVLLRRPYDLKCSGGVIDTQLMLHLVDRRGGELHGQKEADRRQGDGEQASQGPRLQDGQHTRSHRYCRTLSPAKARSSCRNSAPADRRSGLRRSNAHARTQLACPTLTQFNVISRVRFVSTGRLPEGLRKGSRKNRSRSPWFRNSLSANTKVCQRHGPTSRRNRNSRSAKWRTFRAVIGAKPGENRIIRRRSNRITSSGVSNSRRVR